ncbi:hypothetical protein DFP74_3538 [Nocardiopsis sp. Huas11]|nr:hypothetical protein DFP74_3538 [Nocardiopsis sp. Huas11]
MNGGEAGEPFRDDPMARPLTYPGTIPDGSGVLLDRSYVALRPEAGRPAGEWTAAFDDDGGSTLEGVLARLGRAPMADRHPVLAVGSNAAPAQMRRKLRSRALEPVVPMTLADVDGIAPGFSAHVSRPGYVPAAPVARPGRRRLFVLWPDQAQLEAIDATEPNYRRLLLPADRHRVTLASSRPTEGADRPADPAPGPAGGVGRAARAVRSHARGVRGPHRGSGGAGGRAAALAGRGPSGPATGTHRVARPRDSGAATVGLSSPDAGGPGRPGPGRGRRRGRCPGPRPGNRSP